MAAQNDLYPTGPRSSPLWPALAVCTPDIVPTRQGYDRWSDFYDKEDNPLICLEEPVVEGFIGAVRGLRVLDIGCGTGRWSLRLAADGAVVTGVDFSTGMLQRALAKSAAGSVRIINHDITRPMPFRDQSFDRIICCLVLEHITELESLFAEMRRICHPDGFIVISDLHPAMSLLGIQARFTDPASGLETRPRSACHQTSDYVMAAARTGLIVDRMTEQAVDQRLAARSPRGRKYLGWPMLLAIRLVVMGDSHKNGEPGRYR